jgi:uncharacterized protein (DUF1778 family)
VGVIIFMPFERQLDRTTFRAVDQEITRAAAERSARLNMRVAPDALETLREAAAAQQQDLTSFVLGAALDRARSVLMEQHVMRLTATEAARLDEAFDREPRVVPELVALLQQIRNREVGGSSAIAAPARAGSRRGPRPQPASWR